jgi:hypothetical protein
MTERAHYLSATADGQIAELINLISTLDQTALDRVCPGREKLGDGTIGAALRHTADNYQRIADFVKTSDHDISASHQPPGQHGHRIPRFLAVLGHRPQDHDRRDHGAGQHDNNYTADIDVDAVVGRLDASRRALARIAALADAQLDAIPPKDSFRFCDGHRTLEQVLTGLLKHQGHQVEAVKTAVA